MYSTKNNLLCRLFCVIFAGIMFVFGSLIILDMASIKARFYGITFFVLCFILLFYWKYISENQSKTQSKKIVFLAYY